MVIWGRGARLWVEGRLRVPALILGAIWLSAAGAAPFTPASDAQVLERLPARASDPRARQLNQLRLALRQDPNHLEAALALAQAYYEAVAAEGDPRYIGYAQAALRPWWSLPEPPPGVRVLRAVLLQFDHRFEPALADLDAVLLAEPDNEAAWAWRAAIHMVRANYVQARRSCEGLAPLVPAIVATACIAQVDATTGQTAAAALSLRVALQDADEATPAQRLWVLTRLAETEERRGEFAAAEAAFRDALALDISDTYLLAAFADFLLDQGRPAEVLKLLKDRGRADVLLLRQALAAHALAHSAAKPPAAAVGGTADSSKASALASELSARFAAARLRGDTTHRKEESRFLLALGPKGPGNLQQALSLASANFAEQREPADARILFEAALAAADASAAAPALQWLADSKIDSLPLAKLAAQIKGLR